MIKMKQIKYIFNLLPIFFYFQIIKLIHNIFKLFILKLYNLKYNIQLLIIFIFNINLVSIL